MPHAVAASSYPQAPQHPLPVEGKSVAPPLPPSQQPFVSVALPVYNGAALMRRALDSVLNQTYSNWELVVHDNHSTDDTPRIVEEYARRDRRVRHIRLPETVPMLENFSRTLHQTRGEWVTFMGHDDWLSQNYLAELVEAVLARPDVAYSFGLVHAWRLTDGGLVDLGQPPRDDLVLQSDYVLKNLYRVKGLHSYFCLARRQDLLECFPNDTPNPHGLDYTECWDKLVNVKLLGRYPYSVRRSKAVCHCLDRPDQCSKRADRESLPRKAWFDQTVAEASAISRCYEQIGHAKDARKFLVYFLMDILSNYILRPGRRPEDGLAANMRRAIEVCGIRRGEVLAALAAVPFWTLHRLARAAGRRLGLIHPHDL